MNGPAKHRAGTGTPKTRAPLAGPGTTKRIGKKRMEAGLAYPRNSGASDIAGAVDHRYNRQCPTCALAGRPPYRVIPDSHGPGDPELPLQVPLLLHARPERNGVPLQEGYLTNDNKRSKQQAHTKKNKNGPKKNGHE